jgi:CO dehydrogenase/acetyl-CoA synthase delta subunit
MLLTTLQTGLRNVQNFGADLICLKLDGIHPDRANKGTDETVSTVKSILEAVEIPLIIWDVKMMKGTTKSCQGK